jgi:hypothetical protein
MAIVLQPSRVAYGIVSLASTKTSSFYGNGKSSFG